MPLCCMLIDAARTPPSSMLSRWLSPDALVAHGVGIAVWQHNPGLPFVAQGWNVFAENFLPLQPYHYRHVFEAATLEQQVHAYEEAI